MSERDAFLRAICADPDDDTPRLVFADWLDEHGDPDRAAFIRLQIELTGLPAGKKQQNRQARETELLDAHRDEWTEALKPYFAYYYHCAYASYYAPPVVFRRGFVETLAMDVGTFVDRGEEVFALAPVRVLRLQDAQSFDNLADCASLLRLRGLDFPGAVLADDGTGMAALLRSKYLANLTSLVLRGHDDNGHLDAPGLRALAGTRHLAKLERLDIGDNWLFGPNVPARESTAHRKLLWALGEKMPALRELRLGNTGLRDGEVSGLVGHAWVSRLRALDLRGNHVAEYGCRSLCESEHLADLESLDLTGNEYHDTAADAWVPLSATQKQMLKKRFGKGVAL